MGGGIQGVVVLERQVACKSFIYAIHARSSPEEKVRHLYAECTAHPESQNLVYFLGIRAVSFGIKHCTLFTHLPNQFG
jgi:hypothetical protein